VEVLHTSWTTAKSIGTQLIFVNFAGEETANKNALGLKDPTKGTEKGEEGKETRLIRKQLLEEDV
jgi:hypothetical protein